MRVYHTVALLPSLSAVISTIHEKGSPEIRIGATDGSTAVSSTLSFPSSYQSRAIVPSRLDIYMAIAGAPTPPAGVCAPRPELKPPHYHRGGPWRARRERGKVRGGRRMRSLRDEAAAGESVLRILEVMSRAVLYNTRSRPSQSRPLFSPFLSFRSFRPTAAAAPLLPRITGILMKNGNSKPPSVFPPTSFLFKRLKNFFLGLCTSES